MEVTYDRVDVAAAIASGNNKPVFQRRRERLEEWYVPDKPIQIGRPTSWSYFRQGDFVAIPLFPYLVRPDPDLAMAFSATLMANCWSHFRSEILRLHIVTGVPVESAEGEHAGLLRFWFGFAITLPLKDEQHG